MKMSQYFASAAIFVLKKPCHALVARPYPWISFFPLSVSRVSGPAKGRMKWGFRYAGAFSPRRYACFTEPCQDSF